MRHSKAELARQLNAIHREGAVPFAQLTELAGVTERTLIRWACKGKRGVFLDAVHDRPTDTWYSSQAAVLRFIRAMAEAEEAADIGPAATER